MDWHYYSIIMIIAYAFLLLNCGAFLIFGWHFPATFRRQLGARLKAWAGVCLGLALVVVSFLSALRSAVPAWPFLPIFILLGLAGFFAVRAGRLPQRDNNNSGQSMRDSGQYRPGRHARGSDRGSR